MAAFAAEVGAKVEAVAAQGREESAAVRCGARSEVDALRDEIGRGQEEKAALLALEHDAAVVKQVRHAACWSAVWVTSPVR